MIQKVMMASDEIRFVRLERLPAGLEFPAELAARISYDAPKQRLQFQGFMSKTDFDKLVRLHNDLAFQRALEQLFQLCTFRAAVMTSPSAGSGTKHSLVVTGAAAVVVVSCVLAVVLWRMFRTPDDDAAARSLPPPAAIAVHQAGL